MGHVRVVMIAFVLMAGPVLAQNAASSADGERYSLGIGYAGSVVETDGVRDGDERVVLGGWGMRLLFGLKGPWALQARYLEVEDDLQGGEFALDEIGLHAVYAMHRSRAGRFRAHAKLGLAWTAFEESIPLVGFFSDEELGTAVGLGFEYGLPRYAFFADFNATFVNIQLAPGYKETFTVANAITGIAFRF